MAQSLLSIKNCIAPNLTDKIGCVKAGLAIARLSDVALSIGPRYFGAMGQNVNQAQAKLFERMSRWFAAPVLTRGRIWFAYAVAVATDTVQLMLGPLGWAFIDEGLDVVAMILTSRALGFHMLLLPTFVAEFIPVIDMLPTWTACTATVIMLRKKTQAQPPGQPQPPVIDPIDISSEVRRAPAKEQPDGRP